MVQKKLCLSEPLVLTTAAPVVTQQSQEAPEYPEASSPVAALPAVDTKGSPFGNHHAIDAMTAGAPSTHSSIGGEGYATGGQLLLFI